MDKYLLFKLKFKPLDTSSSTADNRNLLDLESNQKMTKEEIQELKEKGITGEVRFNDLNDLIGLF